MCYSCVSLCVCVPVCLCICVCPQRPEEGFISLEPVSPLKVCAGNLTKVP